MAELIYGPNVASAEYTYSSCVDNKAFAAPGGGYQYSDDSKVFNGSTIPSFAGDGKDMSLADFNKITGNGLPIAWQNTIMIGQNFGADNKKAIRKIRYQYVGTAFLNTSYASLAVTVKAGDSLSGLSVAASQSFTTHDFGWNEFLIAKRAPAAYWVLVIDGYNHSGAGEGDIPMAIGGVEMMEAFSNGNKSAFAPYIL